jgi:TRAP-type C4-dicarboxylate transport system permease small subunit
MKLFQRIDCFVYRFFLYIGITCFLALFVVLACNVAIREFKLPFRMSWYSEVVEILFAYMVMFTAVVLAHERQHFKVDLLLIKYGNNKKFYILEVFTNAVALVFFICLTFFSIDLVKCACQTMSVLRITKRWAYLCVPISAFLMSVYALRDMWESLSVFTGKKAIIKK